MNRVFDYGYPKNFGDPHFGLYQPVLDCFLLVVTDLTQAQEIKLLASSRYSLYVVDLTTAENYSANIIDNTCCENWKISNKQSINIGMSDGINSLVKAVRLETADSQDPDILNEKLYLQTVWYHVKYCLHIEYHARKQIHDWIDGILELEFEDTDHVTMKNCIKKIKRVLYQTTDLAQIENEIQQIKSEIKEYYRHDDFTH